MKPQRLTSTDIETLAEELDRFCGGKTIVKIGRHTAGVEFSIGSMAFSFCNKAGAPYLILSKSERKLQPWLAFLIGSKIELIAQLHSDRIIVMRVAKVDRLGRRKIYLIFLEMFGAGDIIATTAELKILAGFRNASSKSPGTIYQPVGSQPIKDASEIFSSTIGAIDERGDKKQSYRLIYGQDNQIVGFGGIGAESAEKSKGEIFPTLLETLTNYVASLAKGKSIDDRLDSKAKRIEKIESKIKKIEGELAATAEADKFRKYGAAILARLNTIKKGDKTLRLPADQSETGEEIAIELEQSLGPQANAKRYFDKARHLEKAKDVLAERLKRLTDELEKLKSTDVAEESNSSGEPIKQTKDTSRMPFRQFDMGDGWIVYCGKSAADNDQLTFGFAAKHDIWFHAWQAGGSHVVLRKPDKKAIASKTMIEKAASLAAYYSKAKTSSKAPVVYAEVRYLRKVKGIPGKVIVNRQSQLMVKPKSPAELFGSHQ